jgi:gliding motility-associated-like protein
MALTLPFPSKLRFLDFIIVLGLFFFTSNASAQCDSTNNSIVVCNVSDVSSKTVNLFCALLSYTPGGVWNDDSFTGGLNPGTGSLDVQAIGLSGVFSYTYAVVGSSPSTVFVTVGGYSGVSNLGVPVCSDNENFNLFLGFKGDFLSPQSNGIWHDDDGTGAINGNYLNASVAGLGPHHFTYTMPAIGSCPSTSSTVLVTVKRAPEPGVPTDLKVCSDNIISYRNVNLFDLLTGEDPNGLWKESTTSELASGVDSTVDVQHIYNMLGAGVYNFTYTVKPIGADNTICSEKTSNVSIIIDKQLDFTGSKVVVNSDICESDINTATYKAVLQQGNQNIPDGNYFISYNIVGSSSAVFDSVTASFTNGVLNFDINRSKFPQVGVYTVTITDIVKVGGLGLCNNVIGLIVGLLHVNPMPKINSGTLIINAICKGESANAVISGDIDLVDGNYSIIYNLSGKNSAIAQQAVFEVINGVVGDIPIPFGLISIDGNTTFTIAKITNLTTGCTNTSTLSKIFVVKPVPDLANLKLLIEDVCQGEPLLVQLSGLGTVTNITLGYTLTGANIELNQTITVLVSFGNASFSIPSYILANTGMTSLVLTNLIDNANGCGAVPNNAPINFIINPIPNQPISNNSGSFCKNEYKTIGDLSPNGSQYQWFNSEWSTTILGNNTLLESRDYYVKEVNAATKCESSKTKVSITIEEEDAPVLNLSAASFCGLDEPTINNLTAITTANGTIEWYDTAINGKRLAATELLKEGFTYYGFSYSSTTTCYSDVLEVTVSLTNCDVTPEFFIPDGFSPNGDGVNDSFRIPNIEFIYPNFTLDIYSRYGNLLFSGNKNKLEWDGKNSDFEIGIDGVAPNGVYFYIINHNKGIKAPKQGQLYLNR